MMASKSSNFLDGLEFYFITKKLVKVRHKLLVDKIQRFEGTVSNRFNENTTHARAFPRGEDYHSSGACILSIPHTHRISPDCVY